MRDTAEWPLVRLVRNAAGQPEAATGAITVANRIFSALGYYQVENHLVSVGPESLIFRRGGARRPPEKGDR